MISAFTSHMREAFTTRVERAAAYTALISAMLAFAFIQYQAAMIAIGAR